MKNNIWKSLITVAVILGLLCLGMVLAESTVSEPRSIRAGMDLLGVAEVQNDLKLTADQKSAIEKAFQQARDELKMVPRDKRPDQMQKIYETAQSKLDAILNAGQKDRLSQIEVQSQGTRGLIREDTASKLTLTSEQRSKIQAIFQAEQQAINNIRLQVSDPAQLKQKLNELKLQNSKKVSSILTADQQKRVMGIMLPIPNMRWKKLTQ